MAMNAAHVPVGLLLVGVTVGFFGLRYFRKPKKGQFSSWGWAGLGILFLAETSLLLGVRWVAIYFTPLCWTAYLLIIDAAVVSLKGTSRMAKAARGFFILALTSIPLWLIFEAYNLRMQNWTYVGLPSNALLRNLGYGWSFATIWPAIFETADFVQALGFFKKPIRPHAAFTRGSRGGFVFLGLMFLIVPVVVPSHLGRYLFGPVWAGFLLLLDPLNYRWGGRSLLREWEEGSGTLFWSLVVSGLVCGVFWEFWNYWAAARWVYIFPILQGWRIFAMPIPGYLGFPAFALECFVMYEFLRVVARLILRSRTGEGIPERYSSATGSK